MKNKNITEAELEIAKTEKNTQKLKKYFFLFCLTLVFIASVIFVFSTQMQNNFIAFTGLCMFFYNIYILYICYNGIKSDREYILYWKRILYAELEWVELNK
jgi:hypothetical protein